jgi:hypothetical protein
MKLIKMLVIAALAAIGTVQTPASAATSGLLGQKYLETDFTLQPVNAYLDVGAAYSYGWLSRSISAHTNTLGATATGYFSFAGMKPFLSAGLGEQWVHTQFGSSDFGVWGVGAGVEIPSKVFTVTPSISYTDDLQRSTLSSQQFTFGVELSRWVTKTTSAYAAVSYSDISHINYDAWNYSVGLRVKF